MISRKLKGEADLPDFSEVVADLRFDVDNLAVRDRCIKMDLADDYGTIVGTLTISNVLNLEVSESEFISIYPIRRLRLIRPGQLAIESDIPVHVVVEISDLDAAFEYDPEKRPGWTED